MGSSRRPLIGVFLGPWLALGSAAFLSLGCGGGGQQAAAQPPSTTAPVIHYAPNSLTGDVDTPIPVLAPTNSGGASSAWSIGAALPAGLVFNTETGQISGTPTVASAMGAYTVMASNANGTGRTTVNLAVNAIIQPPVISYSPNSVAATTGVAITPLTPANTGGKASSWAIAPGLPAGLFINAYTGKITGTPTAPQVATTYTVTATNSKGSGTTTLTIAVNAAISAPAISYSPSSVTGVVGTAIQSMVPTNTGGAASSWSITPSLPVGLVFNSSTGQVSGTPTATNPLTTYTVTATNTAGSGATTLAIAVNNATTQGSMWVMGYYVGYHSGLQSPDQVDYSSMTHILVGAAEPSTNGTFDTSFFIGSTAGPAWAHDTVNRAHAAGIKAILMVGGAGYTDAFRATQNATVRTAFVTNLQAIVNQYGFDGIDLDWEPLEISGVNDDRARATALMQALHAAMPNLIYTFPCGWNNANFNDMQDPFWGTFSQYFDRVNVMSYEMNWQGDGWSSWHFSPLYGETATTPSSVDNSVSALITAGVPAGHIGIGLGLYGQPWENGDWVGGNWTPKTSAPFVTAPHQATDHTTVRVSDNEVSYSVIMRYYYDPSALRWDDAAKATYLSFSAPKSIPVPAWAVPNIVTTYVTYEDERSIAAKGAYAKAKGLGGAMVWTISEGYLEWQTTGEKDPLMKAVKQAFLN